MNEYLSKKLRVISFISMIMVVFLHSYNINIKLNSGIVNFNSEYNIFIQEFFSQGITRFAVPMFFIISGYLLFLNYKWDVYEIVIKYKKRAKSLLLPYLLWSIWGLFFFFILQMLPPLKSFIINEPIANYSFYKILDTIFINPVPYQFWFVRDLIVFVILSPLIYFIIKYFRIIPILFFFIVWFNIFEFNFIIFSNESILFFSFGAYLSINKSNLLLKKLTHKYYLLFLLFWITIVFIKTYLSFEYTFIEQIIHKISIMIGLIAAWSLYDIMYNNNSDITIFRLSSFSFFVYASHEPVLTIVKKGMFFIIGNTDGTSLIIYFFAPILTIAISILVGSLLKRRIFTFYSLITGGR